MKSTLPFIDIHSHIQSTAEEVFTVVNVNLGKKESWSADYMACSVGVHPWHIDKNEIIKQFFLLEDACKEQNVIAVGEAGLDKFVETPMSLQTKVFEQQIEIAEFYQKPVIVHCVGAYYEVIAIRKKLKTTVPFIIHGFNKNTQVLHDLLQNDFHISFGAAIAQSNSPAANALIEMSLDRLFLETDDKNTPIQGIYIATSEILRIEIESLKKTIHENFNRIFDIR